MLKELTKIANKLDKLGLTKEADELDGIIRKMAGSPISVCLSEKPNFDEEALKKLFLDYVKEIMNDDDVKIYDTTAKLEWGDFDEENCPSYKFFVVIQHSFEADPRIEDFDFYLVSEAPRGDGITVTVKDKEGKEHHFQGAGY